MYLQAAVAFFFHDNYKNIEINFLQSSEWRAACGIKTGKNKRETLKSKDIQFVKDTFNIDVNDDIADAIGLAYGYLQKQETDQEWN